MRAFSSRANICADCRNRVNAPCGARGTSSSSVTPRVERALRPSMFRGVGSKLASAQMIRPAYFEPTPLNIDGLSAQTVDVQGRRLEIGQRANDPPGLIREPELAVRFVEPETRGLRDSGELRPRKGGRIANDMNGNRDVDFPAKTIEFPIFGQG